MRRPLPSILVVIGCMLPSAAGAQGLPARADPPPEGLLISGEAPPPDDAELAGLPPGSHPAVLTWERAYTLALIRCRAPGPAGPRALAESLDPKTVAEQAGRLGVADFGRFRADFFGGEGFIDPSGSLSDLFRRLQVVENATKLVDALEQLKAAAGALDLPRPDRLDARLRDARRRLQGELLAYRDRLDAVKDELGLSPHAPVVPDRTSLARFRAAFEKIDEWFADPGRDPAALPAIVATFPRLEGRLLGLIAPDGVSGGDPRKMEGLARDAEQIAIKNRGRGGLDEETRQRLRRRVRYLLETRAAYQAEGPRLLLAIRAKDQAFEQMMMAPPAGAVVGKVPDLIALHIRVLESEDQLVTLWASYQAERLALARDLRVLPGHDWKSFYAQIMGGPDAVRVPAVNPPVAPARPVR